MCDNMVCMSGHSKWSTIKRAKAVNDSKRSQIFSKVSRALTVAARQGGGDPDTNPALRMAIEKAKEARMPKDNIERAINKGMGVSKDGESFEEAVYEGYGPGGVAFMVSTITDNKNRTVADIRNIFGRFGGSLGGAGSTSYVFGNDPQNPSFNVEVTDKTMADKLVSLSEELDNHDDVNEVYSNFELVNL
jgi:YebC/PmpR family DNA-binding regulatory protein